MKSDSRYTSCIKKEKPYVVSVLHTALYSYFPGSQTGSYIIKKLLSKRSCPKM